MRSTIELILLLIVKCFQVSSPKALSIKVLFVLLVFCLPAEGAVIVLGWRNSLGKKPFRERRGKMPEKR